MKDVSSMTDQLVALRSRCAENPVALLLWKSLIAKAHGISFNDRSLFAVTKSGSRITTAVLQTSKGREDIEGLIKDPVIAPFVGPYDERLARLSLIQLPTNVQSALSDFPPGRVFSADVLRERLASCAA